MGARCRTLLIAGILVALAGCSSQVASQSPSARPSLSVTPLTGPPASPAPSPSASPAPLQLVAIQLLNPRVGYIAGWPGSGLALAKTSDAGASWQRIAVPADELSALRFIDDQVGWVGGWVESSRGVVLRTDDGGHTWREALAVPLGTGRQDPIQQIQAVDGRRAWVLSGDEFCGTGACPMELRRTTDGGQTWTIVRSGPILAMRFASVTRGWVLLAGSDGTVTVVATSDGGTTWAFPFRAAGDPFSALDAATTESAWFMTRDGAYCTSSNCSKYELFRTDNGGVSWRSLGNPKAGQSLECSFGHISGPLFASPSRGWLAFNQGAGGVGIPGRTPGGLYRSDDGGVTWRCSKTPPNTTQVSAADPGHAWVLIGDSPSGLDASDDGGQTWRALDLSAL